MTPKNDKLMNERERGLLRLLANAMNDLGKLRDSIAASRDAQGDDVLPCPLRVGAGTFGKGIKISTVQGAIDRAISYRDDEISKLRAAQGESVVPLPREECEKFQTVTVTKNEDGTFGYSAIGMLPSKDFVAEVLRQNNAAQSEDAGWKTMESAPRDGTEIIVFSPDRPQGKECTIVFWRPDGWAFLENDAVILYLEDTITHYRPLPAPPVIGE